MFIITYDITENRVRTKFSKFLQKYGRRLQYSVFEIKNSQRILDNILLEIDKKYKKQFKESDSILIFSIGEENAKKMVRYGYSVQEEKPVLIW